MPGNPASPVQVTTGSHGGYQWLTTTGHDLDSFLTLCPIVLLGKYVAVTSFDSGSLTLNDTEKSAGWESRKGIAYSPLIKSTDMLPERGGWDEWYVFPAPVDLGQLEQYGNIFEASLLPGEVYTLVNFGPAFALDKSELQSPAKEFWRQMEWIHPESFIADDDGKLSFVSNDRAIFESVHEILMKSP
jgi:hypothetical protein